MYDPETLVRLPLHNGSAESDELLLGSIEVMAAN
jgi:hypothetical protein